MDMLGPYAAMVATLTLAILSPGPAIIAAMQTSFARGRAVALGVLAGVFVLVWALRLFVLHSPALPVGQQGLAGLLGRLFHSA